MNFFLPIALLLIISGCGQLDFTELDQGARTYVVKDDYQTVFYRYASTHSNCQMMGWKVMPLLIPDQKRGTITVASAHEELYFYEVSEMGPAKTQVRYNHGMLFNKEKFYTEQRAVGEGVLTCGAKLPDNYQ